MVFFDLFWFISFIEILVNFANSWISWTHDTKIRMIKFHWCINSRSNLWFEVFSWGAHYDTLSYYILILVKSHFLLICIIILSFVWFTMVWLYNVNSLLRKLIWVRFFSTKKPMRTFWRNHYWCRSAIQKRSSSIKSVVSFYEIDGFLWALPIVL